MFSTSNTMSQTIPCLFCPKPTSLWCTPPLLSPTNSFSTQIAGKSSRTPNPGLGLHVPLFLRADSIVVFPTFLRPKPPITGPVFPASLLLLAIISSSFFNTPSLPLVGTLTVMNPGKIPLSPLPTHPYPCAPF
ncbi:hypothetical protein AX774_g3921 [Zancudomyces culisetae]|uniref:Uncharacterized protein n=1 Tax=Zancudomyces culisetae TaxID=1213189 RepID=A0A1R1PNR0_ZANCU|nr:hypothetical protein AX774_g3921 [Zancudomyces culisetae]|eukprot:OMH82590.1 hypothetical protein AX774_g3921 [Zancudomyces culisetae]